MGLFSFLKSKFSKKENKTTEEAKTYEKGLEKSRKAFASKLDSLSKRYASVNEEYFEELERPSSWSVYFIIPRNGSL